MKRLPRKKIHNYYNQMDNTVLNSAQMCITPAILVNANATYSIFQDFSAFSASWHKFDDGINYNNGRLSAQIDPSTCQDIPIACNGLAHFLNTDLYRLQNPSAYAPMVERPVLVREIVKNYLQYPEYHLVSTDLDTLFYLSGFDGSGYSATTPTVFKGNINQELCKCKEDCECRKQQENTVTTNNCNCLEQFELEYQEFIEMLRRNRKKLPDTEEFYLSAWVESGCNCEQI